MIATVRIAYVVLIKTIAPSFLIPINTRATVKLPANSPSVNASFPVVSDMWDYNSQVKRLRLRLAILLVYLSDRRNHVGFWILRI